MIVSRKYECDTPFFRASPLGKGGGTNPVEVTINETLPPLSTQRTIPHPSAAPKKVSQKFLKIVLTRFRRFE